MVRRNKTNKLESLKRSLVNQNTGISDDLQEKYERGKKAVNELQDMAKTITQYVQTIRAKGIDVDYIKNNAEQIHTIFFAVMELLENEAENRSTEESATEESATEETTADETEAETAEADGICPPPQPNV